MVEGQAGLNIKDYPFAFSIAALFFPNLLSDSSFNFSILGILLIGGMLGSLLTIINPLGLLIKYYYARKYSSEIHSDIFPNIHPVNNMTINIVGKNFKAALTSPSISFEIDKTVAMLYFIIILAITIFRSFMGDFTSILNDNQYLIWSVRLVSIAGLVGVTLVLLHHHFGFNFKTEIFEIRHANFKRRVNKPSLSQLYRIVLVTIANLAIDFANLTNEINKWSVHGLENDPIRHDVLKKLYKFDGAISKVLSSKFTDSYASFEGFFNDEIQYVYKRNNCGFNTATIANLYQRYKSIKAISLKYDVCFSEALPWVYNLNLYFKDLYDIESQVRASIESRDWNNVDLAVYRITDPIETLLQTKNILPEINDKTNS